MTNIADFISSLKKRNIRFFTGVPDSILKQLSLILEKKKSNEHVVATNEGSAISLGIGYYLATKKIPCVYLQNSGLGNAINPLISIVHKKVYSIPMLLIIGWRGAPKSNDEPQHMIKGKITRNLLKLLNIKFMILNNKKDLKKLEKLILFSSQNKVPVACLIKKDSFINSKTKTLEKLKKNSREIFIKDFLKTIPRNSKIVSTTGYTSRELFQIRKENKIKNGKDFYMIGGMGHASMVSLGISSKFKGQVFCLDGDGSLLMHMGSMRTIGNLKSKNFKHILLNNNMHESVGGQVTHAKNINFNKLVKSIGYKNYFKVNNELNYTKAIKKLMKSSGPSLLEVKINPGTIKNLIRPKNFLKIKEEFMK